jgi:hypothetical protein
MTLDPSLDFGASPDTACSKFNFRLGEVLIRPSDLIGPLSGQAEHLRDLG